MSDSEQTAGERDPLRAAQADRSMVAGECLHPKPSTLTQLHCRICGVFVIDGLVSDVGRSKLPLGQVLYSPAIAELIAAARVLNRDFDSWDEQDQRKAIHQVLAALELVDEEAKKLASR